VEIWPLGMNRCEKWLAVTSKNSQGFSWNVLMLHARPNLLPGFKVATKAIWNPVPPLFDTIPYN
jgi:hypothetical protein